MKTRKYLQRALRYYAQERLYIIILILLLALTALVSMAMPHMTRALIDRGFGQRDRQQILVWTGGLLAICLASALLRLLKESVRLDICNAVRYRLRRESLLHLFRIPETDLHSRNASEIFHTLEEDTNCIASIAGEDTLELISSLCMAAGGAAALVTISPALTLIVVLYVPAKYILSVFLGRLYLRISKKCIDCSRTYSHWYGDTVEGISLIRHFAFLDRRMEEFDRIQKESLRADRNRHLLSTVREESENVLIQVMMSAIYLTAGILLLREHISLGGIVAFETYALLLAAPLSGGIDFIYQVSGILPSLERYFTFMDMKEEETPAGTAAGGAPEGTGEEIPASHKIPGKADASRDRQEALRIRHLTYSYEPGRPVLQDFELTVRPGEKIGILGHNGTGKSTLIRLLSKDLQPQSGRILYGDRDLQEISREDWPETAGVVSQECFLFDESLTYNMLLGRDPGPDRTARIRSLLDMDRDPAFDRADRGKVGDRGKDLSGGQRRKIELARVLLRDTPLILLDEPTAGLDRETKGLLIRILREKLRDKTVLCVTHDEDLLTCFDRTVRLAD